MLYGHLPILKSTLVKPSGISSGCLTVWIIIKIKTNLQRLQRNDRAMIRQICSIKPEDVARVRSSELLTKLQLEDLDLILRERRLRWFGHVERSSNEIRTAYDMQIDCKRGAGRPKQTWKKLTEKDCREWKLTTVHLKKGAPGDQV